MVTTWSQLQTEIQAETQPRKTETAGSSSITSFRRQDSKTIQDAMASLEQHLDGEIRQCTSSTSRSSSLILAQPSIDSYRASSVRLSRE